MRRNGFTLLEMIITMAIIAIVASLILAVSLAAVGNSRVQTTKATITKIRGLLEQRMAAFDRLNLAEWKVPESTKVGIDIQDPIVAAALSTTTPAVTVIYPTSPPSYRDIAGGNPRLALILLRKGAYRRYFPQTWAEVSAWGMDAELGIVVPSSTGDIESAEVLYWMLTQAPLPGYSVDGSIIDTLPTVDSNGNGFPEIVDAWQQPLRFIRWPTRMMRASGIANGTTVPPAPSVALSNGPRAIIGNLIPDSQLASDPDDGLFLTANIPGWAIGNFEDVFHTPWTWSVPLVTSAGPDGDTGILPVSTPPGQLGGFLSTNESLMFDNVTNLNIKSGGK